MPKKKHVENSGTAIKIEKYCLVVPNNPIIPFIKGDGTGPDIWTASVRVFDAAVRKVYKGRKQIYWKEIFAGKHAFNEFGEWL
ncbi:MAG TPA: isocitrate/isopropylmalate family dehydrogenase, partial [Candidatus Wunengus californicus]|uniref:isocitrate/isopropylmalate family dehydrogenase n=1 Tax=Candidatus Wunengus californicus TaxID=3367619 RepID=UPI004028E058